MAVMGITMLYMPLNMEVSMHVSICMWVDVPLPHAECAASAQTYSIRWLGQDPLIDGKDRILGSGGGFLPRVPV